MNFILLSVVVVIIVFIAFDIFIDSRTSIDKRDALHQFVQNQGLQKNSGVFGGTLNGRNFELVSESSDWTGNIRNIAVMKVSVLHEPDTNFRLTVRPDWGGLLYTPELGFYNEVEDLSIQPKVVHNVNVGVEEIEPKKLFNIHSMPKGYVDKVLGQDQHLKLKIVEVNRMLLEKNNYALIYELVSGKLSVEFCYRDIRLDELEFLAENLSAFANTVEKAMK